MRCFADRPDGVHAMLAKAVAWQPDGVALICGEESVTYREFDDLVGRAAESLSVRGVGCGNRVALTLENSIAHMAAVRRDQGVPSSTSATTKRLTTSSEALRGPALEVQCCGSLLARRGRPARNANGKTLKRELRERLL